MNLIKFLKSKTQKCPPAGNSGTCREHALEKGSLKKGGVGGVKKAYHIG